MGCIQEVDLHTDRQMDGHQHIDKNCSSEQQQFSFCFLFYGDFHIYKKNYHHENSYSAETRSKKGVLDQVSPLNEDVY